MRFCTAKDVNVGLNAEKEIGISAWAEGTANTSEGTAAWDCNDMDEKIGFTKEITGRPVL